MKRCICVSCFDHYTTRIQLINDYFINSGYETKYLYASFNHFSKQNNTNTYKNGVKIKVMAYKKNLSIRRLLSHFMFTQRVMKSIKEYNPDIIYCMIPPNSLVQALANYKSKHKKVKLIFDCYDMWPESFPYTKLNMLLRLPFSVWRDLRRRYISAADLIICVSEQVVQALSLEINNKPIKIIRPVIDSGMLPGYKSDVSELSFCYLGMVNHITDIDLGVKLLGKIAEYRLVSIHIIGEGQNLDDFVVRLKAVNVNVICHGVIFDMNEKNNIFSTCNMGLNIPREEINSTMSLKAVEYMRAGLPFVNSALGDIKLIVEEDSIGINVEKQLDVVVDKILKLCEKDMVNMHDRCILSYQKRFVEQDLDDIFKTVGVND